MAAIERKTKRYLTDLTDQEWEHIAPLLPDAGAEVEGERTERVEPAVLHRARRMDSDLRIEGGHTLPETRPRASWGGSGALPGRLGSAVQDRAQEPTWWRMSCIRRLLSASLMDIYAQHCQPGPKRQVEYADELGIGR